MVYKLYKKYKNIINYFIDFIIATSLYIQFNLSCFIFVLFFVLLIILRKKINIKFNKVILFFSFLVMFTTVIGNAAFNDGSIFYLFNNGWRALHTFYFCASFWYLVYIIIYYIFEFVGRVENRDSKLLKIFNRKSIFWSTWIIVFLSKVPFWLAYYPGYFCYDMHVQTFQILGYSVYTSYQPPIHTLYWLGVYNLANVINVNAVALYEFCQLLFMSCIFTYLLMYLIRKKVSNWIIVLSYIWLILNPVISIFTLATTKDVIFGGLLIIFMVNYVEALSNKKCLKNLIWIFKMICIIVLLCLFRNNFIYAYIALILILLLSFKEYRKGIAVIGITSVVIHFFIITVGYSVLNISAGRVEEKYSVPIQQVAYSAIRHQDELTDDELNLLDFFFDDQGYLNYKYRISDPAKDDIDSAYIDTYRDEFFKLWFNLLLRYPDEYITAFVNLNMPSWYISDLDMKTNYGATYFDTNMYDLYFYEINYESKLPVLLSISKRFSKYEILEDIPIVNIILSIYFVFWFMMFTILYGLFKHRKKQAYAILPLLLFWMTFLLGPTSNFRYMFPIVICYPIMLALIFNSNKLIKND